MPYTPHDWTDGELVTAEDLDRIEQGLAATTAKAEATAGTSVAATRGAGASAGTVTLKRTGHVVTAAIAGLVLTGTSEVAATLPEGWRPPHTAGAGFVRATNGDWWPAHATTTQIMILGPAPAGTTVEGSLTWPT